jgi:methyl-accepting chemotaxis protein PixJ
MLLDNNRAQPSQSNNSSSSVFSRNITPEHIAENIETMDISGYLQKQPPAQTKKVGKRNRLGLRAKATLLAITIGTLPVLVIGATAYYFANQSLTQRISATQQDKAVDLADKINRFMFERYGDIQSVASQPMFSDPRHRAFATQQEKQQLLNDYVRIYQVYDEISIFDLDGNPLIDFAGRTLKNHSGDEFFQLVKQTDRPVMTKPALSKSAGYVVTRIAAPIKDKVTGQTIGVVRARLPVKYLENVAKNFSEGGTDYHVIDPAGKFFIASEEKAIGQDAKADFPGLAELAAKKEPGNLVTFEKAEGSEKLIGYAPINKFADMPPLNWDVLLEIDTNIAFKPQRDLLLTIAVGTGITAVLVGALAAWLANRATRPIQIAASAVEQIGEGKLNTRIPSLLLGSDEMGVLGSNINNMAEQIQQRTQISSLALRMRESTDLYLALDALVEEARQTLGADRVVIYRFKPDWSGYLSHESVLPGLPSALKEAATDPCISRELLEAYRQGRVVVNNDVTERDYHPAHKQLLQRLKVKANLVTPIVQQGQLFGLLVAHYCKDTHTWQPNEIDFMRELSLQTGYAVGQLLFVEQKAKVAEIKERLSEIALKMGKTLNLQDILSTAVEEVRLALRTDRAIVYNFDANWQGTIVAESVDNRWPKSIGATINDPCFADRYVEKYRGGRIQATSNIYMANLTECHLKQLEPFAVKANLVAPILRSKELIGLLIVHQCDAPRDWDENEIELMRQLAVQLGYTVEQATVVEQIEKARLEARSEADARAEAQRQEKELLQKRALELLMEVDPVSKGDLTVRAKVTEDEIGTVADSYNSTIRNLRQIVEQVQSATQSVAQTTTDSEPKVKDMAAEAVKQVAAIATALEQIETMSKSSQGVAVRAKTATEQVQIASQVVQAGDAAMNRTVSSISLMQSTVSDATKKVKQLGESSQKISKVVKLIRNIAAQTNMLALNASIEAARAGEEGQGFAVVAEQVRSLAQRSASATTEIGQIIEEIQAQTSEVVLAMETGTEQVNTGSRQVEEARQQLAQISEVSAQVNKLVQEIARAAATQTQVSTQVGQTIKDVAVIASNTQTQSGSVADSFSSLLEVAQELQVSVAQFKVS